MELRNGKFYDNGKPIPIEIGNMEQKRLLDKAEATAKLLSSEEGMIVSCISYEKTVEATVSVDCICGARLHKDIDVSDEGAVDEMDGELISCALCKRNYVLSCNGDDLYLKSV